ncbi:hypothetical protein [Desulfobulbus propionicus]|jgi:hypothetical protein
MELSQFFTGLVVLVCAIHLAGVVGRSVFTSSTRGVLEEYSARQPGRRGDWYLFFHCSGLTGSATTKEAAPKQVQAPQRVSATRQGKRRSRASMSC